MFIFKCIIYTKISSQEKMSDVKSAVKGSCHQVEDKGGVFWLPIILNTFIRNQPFIHDIKQVLIN